MSSLGPYWQGYWDALRGSIQLSHDVPYLQGYIVGQNARFHKQNADYSEWDENA